jgi:AcrR family transcriptional regulator
MRDNGRIGASDTRRAMRDLALDAARARVLDRGWGAVRMGEVATEIGTSRQTLHAEFGTKDDLGQALILRETEDFFEAVSARLDSHPSTDVGEVVASAAELALTMVSVNPLLQSVLGGGDEDHGLLPLVTSRGEPLVVHGIELFGDWLRRKGPDLEPRVAEVVVESTVRLLISHAVSPLHDVPRASADLAMLVRLAAAS